MEAPWTTFAFSSCTVPLMLVAVIMLLTAILVNVLQTKTLTVGIAAQEKEKEPEEHDERFATSKFVNICIHCCMKNSTSSSAKYDLSAKHLKKTLCGWLIYQVVGSSSELIVLHRKLFSKVCWLWCAIIWLPKWINVETKSCGACEASTGHTMLHHVNPYHTKWNGMTHKKRMC